MAESVLEVTEQAVIHSLLDPPGKHAPEFAIDCCPRSVRSLEQKRKIEEAEVGNTIGKIAARLVAERQHPMLHQPKDILRLVTEVHDVPYILDVEAVTEFGLKAIADEFQCAAEARGCRPIAAHADRNRFVHTGLGLFTRSFINSITQTSS